MSLADLPRVRAQMKCASHCLAMQPAACAKKAAGCPQTRTSTARYKGSNVTPGPKCNIPTCLVDTCNIEMCCCIQGPPDHKLQVVKRDCRCGYGKAGSDVWLSDSIDKDRKLCRCVCVVSFAGVKLFLSYCLADDTCGNVLPW